MDRKRPSLAACVLIGAFLPLCWLWMQIVHELGHVLGAQLVGGRVEHVELHPLTISRTDIAPNSNPALVVWAGPLFGVAFPLVLWGTTARWHSVRHLFRFFAGFCLVANGAYIGVGTWAPVGDAAVMLKHHTAWPLAVFGIVTVPAGIMIWNRQGQRFGLGNDPSDVPTPVVAGVATMLLLTIFVESAFMLATS